MIRPVNRKKGKSMLLGKNARSACRWTLIVLCWFQNGCAQIKGGTNEGRFFQRTSGRLIQQIWQLTNKINQPAYSPGASCFIALGAGT
jgi:hypothetical protein